MSTQFSHRNICPRWFLTFWACSARDLASFALIICQKRWKIDREMSNLLKRRVDFSPEIVRVHSPSIPMFNAIQWQSYLCHTVTFLYFQQNESHSYSCVTLIARAQVTPKSHSHQTQVTLKSHSNPKTVTFKSHWSPTKVVLKSHSCHTYVIHTSHSNQTQVTLKLR